MTIKWEKACTLTNPEGRTIICTGKGTTLTIESRRRKIPHANGRSGYWEHTTYMVLDKGKEVKEHYALMDAKAYAAEYYAKMNGGEYDDALAPL